MVDDQLVVFAEQLRQGHWRVRAVGGQVERALSELVVGHHRSGRQRPPLCRDRLDGIAQSRFLLHQRQTSGPVVIAGAGRPQGR